MPIDKDADEALDSVFASDRDRGADSAAPEKEVSPPPESKADAEAPKDEPKLAAEEDSSKRYRDPDTGRFVPLTELKSEREKRQEEARLRAEAERRAIALEAQLEESRRYWNSQQQTKQPAQQEMPEEPDPFTQPAEYRQFHDALRRKELFETRVLLSEEVMRSRYQDYSQAEEAFRIAASQDPDLAKRLVAHPIPAKFAYETGKRILSMQRVGPDPEAFEKKIREEERQKVLAELKAGPKSPQRFPGTLADSMSASEQGSGQSDEAMLGDVFSSSRRMKARS